MKRRTGILCFILTLLFALLSAPQASAYNVSLTVNQNGTDGCIVGYPFCCGACNACQTQQCSGSYNYEPIYFRRKGRKWD